MINFPLGDYSGTQKIFVEMLEIQPKLNFSASKMYEGNEMKI